MDAMGRLPSFATGRKPPILLKKSVLLDCPEAERCRGLFFARLREIFVRIPVRPFKISISRAYFFALRTASDFFNRIRQKRTSAFLALVLVQRPLPLLFFSWARRYPRHLTNT